MWQNFQMRALEQKGWLAPAIVGAFFASAWSYIFYPGFMSYDSLHQYRQVIGLIPQTDAHPPIMIDVWRLLIHVVPGAGGVLIFHQIAYVSGLVLFSIGLTNSVGARVAFVVLMSLWPPLAIHMVHIWKDAGMLSAFTLGVGALAAHRRNPSYGLLGLAAAALFYACAVRYNALPIAIPLWVWWGAELLWSLTPEAPDVHVRVFSRRTCGALAIGLLLTVASYGGTDVLRAGLPHVPQTSWSQTWDLIGMSVRDGKDYVPNYMPRSDTSRPLVEELKESFVLTNPLATQSVVAFAPPAGMEEALARDWSAAVRAHPLTFAGYRWDLYSVLLDLSVAHTYYPFTGGIDPNDLGFRFAHIDDATESSIVDVFRNVADTPIYRGWFYLALSILLFGYSVYLCAGALVTRRNFGAIMLAGSCFGVFLPLFVFAPAPDFRYLLWTVMGSLSALSLFVSDWIKTERGAGQ